MQHVFVETNCVVGYAAPPHQRLDGALALADRARSGDVLLHLPSVCLTEAKQPIRAKFHPRSAAVSVRGYLAWAKSESTITTEDAEIVQRC